MITLWMAFWSRAAGGGWPKTPWIVDQLLYGLPFLLYWLFVGPWALLQYAGAVAGKIMGTRQYLDMGNDTQPIRKPNNVDFLIRWLSGKVSPYWYDFVGNTVMGTVSMLIPALVLVFHGFCLASLPLIIAGAARGLAYLIGWRIIPEWHRPNWHPYINTATAIAELFAGLFIAIGFVTSFIILGTNITFLLLVLL